MDEFIKLEDGRRVELTFSCHSSMRELSFYYTVRVCEKRKRTFIDIVDSNNYVWRKMTNEEKRLDKQAKRRELISDEDFQKYLDKYIGSLKPDINLM